MAAHKKELNVQIGARIQAARLSFGIQQNALAEKIGISSQHLAAIESGAKGTSFETLCAICTALQITTDQILMPTDGPPQEIGKQQSALMRVAATVPEEQADLVSELIALHLRGIKKYATGIDTDRGE